MTNFQKVIDFNRVFGSIVNNKIDKDVFTKNPKLVLDRLKLIREEAKELEDAVEQQNMKEIIDALTDILYVVYGMGSALGIDLDKSFDIVHKSNMSKVCSSVKEAELTKESYKNDPRYDSVDYKINGDKYVVYNKSSNKILKSVNYTPANFDEMLKDE